MSSDIVRLTITDSSLFKRPPGSNALNKAILNINSIWGPAIICLPFVMQRSGLIPSLFSFIAISFLSSFSLLCVNETYNILIFNKSSQFSRKFDLINLINTLFTNDIYASLSRGIVYSNHIVFTVMSIFTMIKIILPVLGYFHNIGFFNASSYTQETITGLILISIFALCFLLTKYQRNFFNYALFGSTIFLLVILSFEYVRYKEVLGISHVEYFGTDYTYLYGTVLFSFSYISVMPNWVENPEGREKSIIRYSCLFTLVFKFIFSLTFANILYFSGIFNFSAFISEIYSLKLKVATITFLVLALCNNKIVHTNLLRDYLQNYSKFSATNSLLLSLIFPWLISFTLIYFKSLLSIINWSSLIVFAFVNYILPLTLYIKAIKLSINYEKNYILSAKLNFEDFVYMKASEIGMTLMEASKQKEIYTIVNEVKTRLKNEKDIEEDVKDKLIELFYEYDGNYSTKRSFHQIFCGSLNFEVKTIKNFFYSVTGVLIALLFISIFSAMYHFLINKTLVFNIFLQTEVY